MADKPNPPTQPDPNNPSPNPPKPQPTPATVKAPKIKEVTEEEVEAYKRSQGHD